MSAQTQQQINTDEQQIASGQSVNVPSDNPAAAAVLVQNADQTSQADQFQRSIGSVQGEMQNADSTLNSVITALQQAIAWESKEPTARVNVSDRAAIATEVQGIQSAVAQSGEPYLSGQFCFCRNRDPDRSLRARSHPHFGSDATRETRAQTALRLGNQFHAANQSARARSYFPAPGNDMFQSIQDLITSLQSGTGHRHRGQRSQQCSNYINSAARVLRQRDEPAQLAANLPRTATPPSWRSSKPRLAART